MIVSQEVRDWSGITTNDPASVTALDEVVAATNAVIIRRCVDFTLTGWPDEVHTAALIQASRFYKRRGSPEGIANFGDFGMVRVTGLDADIEAILSPYLKVAFA